MVPVDSVRVSRDPTYSGILLSVELCFVYGTVTLCGLAFQLLPLHYQRPLCRSYNPERETLSVWAIPVSLAATKGIDFSFFSSGYLDVSVLRVCNRNLGINVCLSTTPSLSQTSTPFSLLMPRHPPYTLSSLTTNIQPSQAIQI